ncbi:hypothetical protein SCAR479_00212 [Seiridium cardinale]|uniref:FAD-binding PCMH-type domain-containing protein n=1 Tax=Seiridium cardinale TaxID=138064 RepID=A0ABR2Y996_9PEZI
MHRYSILFLRFSTATAALPSWATYCSSKLSAISKECTCGTTVTSSSALETAIDATGVIKISGVLDECGILDVLSDTTIISVGSNFGLTNGGFRVKKATNIILQNLNPHIVPENLWWKGSWVGHSDSNAAEDTGYLHVTYHHNYFTNVNSRLPSTRFGTGHVYSSCYEGNPTSGIHSRMGAQVLAEKNYILNTKLALVTNLDSDEDGYMIDRNNIFNNSTESITLVGSLTPPYSYTPVQEDMSAIVPKALPSNARLLRDAGLGHRILVPSDADYDARVDSYWSNSAKLKPDCILLPKTAEEVAKAIKPLAAANERFAIRSGGHTNWAGSNNIESGITIDLSALNATIVSPDLKTATIGPGARWRDVYAELHHHHLVVAGGREGNVGVGGLLLGGGLTFFTGRHGFACDNVVAYEVVLADGRIVTADAQSHADLFRSLKGGSSNFGIVTNFTMKTIACDRVWGGMTFYPKQVIPQAIEALCAFAGNVRDDPDSNLVTIFTHMPDFKDIVVATLFNQVGAPAYNKWQQIPQILNTIKMTSVSEMAYEYNIPSNYHTWFTASFRNDTRIVVKASELHDQLVEELKETVPDGNFITQCLFQPLPTLFAENSSSTGGNIMGVEQHSHDGLIFLAAAMFSTADQEALAYPKVKSWVETVKKYAATIDGGNLEWTYLNYADESQGPLRSYGEENVRMMKAVSARYDPQQVFQKLCPGGFKISSVELE